MASTIGPSPLIWAPYFATVGSRRLFSLYVFSKFSKFNTTTASQPTRWRKRSSSYPGTSKYSTVLCATNWSYQASQMAQDEAGWSCSPLFNVYSYWCVVYVISRTPLGLSICYSFFRFQVPFWIVWSMEYAVCNKGTIPDMVHRICRVGAGGGTLLVWSWLDWLEVCWARKELGAMGLPEQLGLAFYVWHVRSSWVVNWKMGRINWKDNWKNSNVSKKSFLISKTNKPNQPNQRTVPRAHLGQKLKQIPTQTNYLLSRPTPFAAASSTTGAS